MSTGSSCDLGTYNIKTHLMVNREICIDDGRAKTVYFSLVNRCFLFEVFTYCKIVSCEGDSP